MGPSDKMNPLLLNERVAWGTLYRVGGLSALIAAVLEIGAVFISIIFARAVPGFAGRCCAVVHITS